MDRTSTVLDHPGYTLIHLHEPKPAAAIERLSQDLARYEGVTLASCINAAQSPLSSTATSTSIAPLQTSDLCTVSARRMASDLSSESVSRTMSGTGGNELSQGLSSLDLDVVSPISASSTLMSDSDVESSDTDVDEDPSDDGKSNSALVHANIPGQPGESSQTSEAPFAVDASISDDDTGSEDSDEIPRGTAIGHSINVKAHGYQPYRPGRYLYLMQVNLSCLESNSVQLMIDTGCSTSWIRGTGYKIVTLSSDPTRRFRRLEAEELREIKYREGSPPYHRTIGDYEALYPRVKKNHWVIQYGNGSYVLLIHPNEAIPFSLPDCQEFDKTGSVRQPIIWRYPFAIAYAMTYQVDYGCFDGVIGLGPSSIQDGLETALWRPISAESAPSFWTATQPILVPMQNDETAIYFNLNPPKTLQSRDSPGTKFTSWMTLNGFPAGPQNIRWSENIPVVVHGPNPSDRHWIVRWTSFQLSRQGTSCAEMVPGTLHRFPGEGVQVLLDTGSSNSYVPLELIMHIQQNVFPTPVNLQKYHAMVASPRATPVAPEYLVPMDAFKEYDHVHLGFMGESGEEHFVALRLDPFLYQVNPTATEEPRSYEGLLFRPLQNLLSHGFYILGMNFYQSLFVALHKRDDHTHYVRFADKNTDDLKATQPPPVKRA